MKRLSVLLVCVLATLASVPAQAHGGGGWHGGGGYGHGYAGYAQHGGGWRGGSWFGPVLGAALVGGAIYAASTPNYVVQQAPVVIQQPPFVVAQQSLVPGRVAYFCSTAQQFYPQVQVCNVPWQPVNY